ncbi:odorant receptor 4-like [Rhynchophorus ferrugineus]|uniref:odorant receptor 4-like n=1 Tax=Rhynchophorus ferrugineus TaxID=354439 RepID=UPI003FCDBC14
MMSNDLLKLIQIPGQLLTALGLWPLKQPSATYRLRTSLTFATITLLATCLTINALYRITDFLQLSKSLYLLISVSLSIMKITVLLLKEDALFVILELLNNPSFLSYLPKYSQHLQGTYRAFKIFTPVYIGHVIVFLILLCIFPSLEGKRLPLDFPFFNYGPYYYPFYAFEVFGTAVSALANVSMDVFTLVLISISTVQLRILNNKLVDTDSNVYVSETDVNYIELSTVKYLSECCIHFSDIENFATLTEKFVSTIIFFQLGASVVAICNSCIMILSVEAFSTQSIAIIIYLNSMFAELGMYCYFGNELYLQSMEIHQSCYFSKWYDRGSAVKKILFILMERTKRPLQMKGCNFIALSATTFVSILKWSYSYFTLLRNTMQESN